MRLSPKSFSINLPWGLGGISLDVNQAAERAAWSLYVELNTRVATKPLQKGEGSVREALTSLYKLFDITRDVLKQGGVDVAKARNKRESLGSISMGFLNDVVRPDLIRWHTSLSRHEAATWRGLIDSGKSVPNNVEIAGALVDESLWEGYDEFYGKLEILQEKLRRYVVILGALAGATESPDVSPIPEDEVV